MGGVNCGITYCGPKILFYPSGILLPDIQRRCATSGHITGHNLPGCAPCLNGVLDCGEV
jgi:hypothetical protein